MNGRHWEEAICFCGEHAACQRFGFVRQRPIRTLRRISSIRQISLRGNADGRFGIEQRLAGAGAVAGRCAVSGPCRTRRAYAEAVALPPTADALPVASEAPVAYKIPAEAVVIPATYEPEPPLLKPAPMPELTAATTRIRDTVSADRESRRYSKRLGQTRIHRNPQRSDRPTDRGLTGRSSGNCGAQAASGTDSLTAGEGRRPYY